MTFVANLITIPGGHIEGIPVEETLLAMWPVLLLTAGFALTMFRGRLRRLRDRVLASRSGRSAQRDYRVGRSAVNPAGTRKADTP
jgi:hypothetical protein